MNNDVIESTIEKIELRGLIILPKHEYILMDSGN